jgi:NitT/TauT family transport system substrate-binding protein
MKKNLFTKFLLLIFSVSLLASCDVFNAASQPLPPLRVGYTQVWGNYTLLVAKEKGFFAEYGVEVEPVYYPIFSDCFSDLAAGQIDAALIAGGDALSINRHTPIRIIGLSDDGGYMSIVASPEITSIQDLKGKKIGTLVGTHYEKLVLDMLATVKMDVSDIAIRNIPPERIPNALAKKEIQAAFSWEPFTSQALKEGAHVLYPADSTLRLFPNTITFSKKITDKRPNDVRSFMYAWFKAAAFRVVNPEDTRQIAAKYIGVPPEQIQRDPSLKTYSYEENIAFYTKDSAGKSPISDIIQKTADYLIASGTLSVMPNIQEIITADYFFQPK